MCNCKNKYSNENSCKKCYSINASSSNYYGNFNCNNNNNLCSYKCSDYLDCLLDTPNYSYSCNYCISDPYCIVNNYYPKTYSYKNNKCKRNKCRKNKQKDNCKTETSYVILNNKTNKKISKSYCLNLLTSFNFAPIYKLKLNDIKDNVSLESDSNVFLGIDDTNSTSIVSEDLSWKISMNGDGTFPFRMAFKSDTLKAKVQGIQETLTNVDIFTLKYPDNTEIGLCKTLLNNNLDLNNVNGIVIRLSLNEDALTTLNENTTIIDTTVECHETINSDGTTTVIETTNNENILPTISLCNMKIKTSHGINSIPDISLNLNNSSKKTVGFLLPLDSCPVEYVIKGDVIIKNSLSNIMLGPDIEIIGANVIC
jgi:hypothetical protein